MTHWCSIRHVNMHKIVTDHICCSSDCPGPQSSGRWRQRHFIGGNAQLQPAKRTKLTYSLIAFNEDNVSPECRRDALPARPAANWLPREQKPSSWFLILNCEFQIISPRDYLSPNRLSLICSINGNSVPIKMSYPNEFNLRWNCLWQRRQPVGAQISDNGNEWSSSINIHPFPASVFSSSVFPSLRIPQDCVEE